MRDKKLAQKENALILPRRQWLLGLGSVVAVVGLSGGVLAPVAAAHSHAAFGRWLQDFRKFAQKEGVKSAVLDSAFAQLKEPDVSVLQKANYQAEFSNDAWTYFDNRVEEEAIGEGQSQAKKYKNWLDRIEKRFGVSRNVLLAIWSMETNYGAALQRDNVLHDVFAALATLGFAGGKRAAFGRSQLLAALKILGNGDVARQQMKSSWAGAMGHTQFIPTSYLRYSVDMDGDGRRDIWNSVPDALASAASLLQKNGWKSGRGWGYEVVLPAGKFPAGSLTVGQWQNLGLKRVRGQAFPHKNEQATLKLPDGRGGPIFLVTDNFSCLKRYNNADRYAFAVGLLADRIGGYSGLVRDWQRPFEPITSAERREVQQRLHELGFYQGRIDGKIGSGSIKAIEAFQRSRRMEVDGYPSRALLRALRG